MRREILEFANSNTPVAAAQKYDVSVTSISLWKKAGLTEGVPESEVTSSAVQRDESILAIWREHPGFGPSQVRNMLRRDGVKVGVSTVRQVMIENGYRPPRAKRREHVGCYEAARPRELYHLDFVHFWVLGCICGCIMSGLNEKPMDMTFCGKPWTTHGGLTLMREFFLRCPRQSTELGQLVSSSPT